MRITGAVAAAFLLVACGGPEEAAAPATNESGNQAGANAPEPANGADGNAAAAAPEQPASGAPVPKEEGEPSNQSAAAPEEGISDCLIQDGKRLDNPPLKAVGTEPFWAARVKGRCVTYSHPENIDGTRVWTTYSPGPEGGGTWSGALGDKLFEMTVRPRPGCSDGMSDKRYPWEVELQVHGERRRGCAERG